MVFFVVFFRLSHTHTPREVRRKNSHTPRLLQKPETSIYNDEPLRLAPFAPHMDFGFLLPNPLRSKSDAPPATPPQLPPSAAKPRDVSAGPSANGTVGTSVGAEESGEDPPSSRRTSSDAGNDPAPEETKPPTQQQTGTTMEPDQVSAPPRPPSATPPSPTTEEEEGGPQARSSAVARLQETYLRAREWEAGRRRLLTGWMSERGLLSTEAEAEAQEREEGEFERLAEMFSPDRVGCSVLYARACGVHDAWLVLIQGAERPYIVVPEDSPAADFLVRLTMLRRTPPYAVSLRRRSASVGPSSSSVTIDLSDDPGTWDALRKSVLEPRLTPFSLAPFVDLEDGGMRGRGRVAWNVATSWVAPRPHGGPESPTGSSAAASPHSPGTGSQAVDLEAEWDDLLVAMGEEGEWMAPLLEAEILGQDPSEALMLPMTTQDLDHHEKGFEEEPQPLLRDGLEIYDPEAVQAEMQQEAEWVEHQAAMAEIREQEEEEARMLWELEDEPMSPYADLDALMVTPPKGSDGQSKEERVRAARKELQTGLSRGIRSFFSALGLADPPAPLPPPEPAVDEEKGESAAAAEAPQQPETGKEGEEDASPPPEPDTVIDLQDAGPSFAATQPIDIPVGDPGAVKQDGEEQPGMRTPTGTERALVEGRWCRLTVSEFTQWRCVAQEPAVEGSFLRFLEHASSIASGPVPGWLADSLGGKDAVRSLASAMRIRRPAMVALGDAQERLMAVVKEMTQMHQPGENGEVRSQRISFHPESLAWTSLCGAIQAVEEAHARCMGSAHLGKQRPSLIIDQHEASVAKGKEKGDAAADEKPPQEAQ